MKLRYLLILVFFTLALGPVTLLLLWPQSHIFESELDEVQERHLLIAQNLSSALSRYHRDLTSTFGLFVADADHWRHMKGTAEIMSNLSFRHVCLAENDTGIVTSSLVLGDSFCPEVVPEDRLRALSALAKPGITAFSEVMTSADGTNVIFLVQRSGDLIALGAIDTTYFQELGSAISFGVKGHAAIVDHMGHALSHPLESWIAERKDMSELSAVQRMMNGETGVEQFYSPALKSDMIAGFTSVEPVGWGVMIPQPIAELQSKAASASRSIMFVLLFGVAAASILAICSSILLARPLEWMNTQTQRIADGDLTLQPRSKHARFWPIEFQSVYRNVREMVTRLQQFNANACRLNLAAQAANLGIYERESDNNFVQFDEGMSKIMGVAHSDGKAAPGYLLNMVLPDDQVVLKAAMELVWKGQSPSTPTLLRIVRPDGELRHIQAHWAPEPRDGSPVKRVIGIYEDVTHSLNMQQEKTKAEDQLNTVIKNLPGAVLSGEMPPNGQPQIKFISRNCVDIWGYSSEELMANPKLIVEQHDPDAAAAIRASFRSTTDSSQPINRRYGITSRTGDHKWIDLHASATRLENGTVQVEGIFLDVSAEVSAQKQLELQTQVAHQAQKKESIGHLTGGIAHDFNNLLAVIMGNLELLRDELTDPDQLSQIDAGIAATLRGADLTQSMLAFASKARLAPSAVDLNQLVRNTKNWTGRTLPSRIKVETSLPADLWPILADPSSTESALLNLILNARDAMETGGILTIETSNVLVGQDYLETHQLELKPGRYVTLAVSDTGHGVPPELVSEIFQPFFSTKGPTKGSGLGLSMIQGFMHQSGGAVQVNSEQDVGTTFKLYFSAVEDGSKQTESNLQSSSKASCSGRILVAEDQDDVLQVIVTSLEKVGYEVTPATSGDQALDLFESNPHYDLLLTDIMMPGTLLGTALAQRLRDVDPTLPVIFMSGYASELTAHENGSHVEDVSLMKPVQRRELLAAIAKMLEK